MELKEKLLKRLNKGYGSCTIKKESNEAFIQHLHEDMVEAIIPIIEAEVKAERLHIGAMVCIAKNELGWGFPPEEYIEITEKLQPIIEYCGKDLKEEVE